MGWDDFNPFKVIKETVEGTLGTVGDIASGGKKATKRFKDTEKTAYGGYGAPTPDERAEQRNRRVEARRYRKMVAQRDFDLNVMQATSDEDLMKQARLEFNENPQVLKDDDFVNSLLSAYSTRGAELKSGRTQRKSSLGGGAQAGYSLLG